MKSVIMISYWFPPYNTIASVRAAMLAKYLPCYGWQPDVICAKWTSSNCVYDPNMIDLPETVRINECVLPHPSFNRTFTRRLYSNLSYLHIGMGLNINIFKSQWVNNALTRIEKIIYKKRPLILWATAPPLDSIYIAQLIDRKYGIPWVADFRDTLDNSIAYRGNAKQKLIFKWCENHLAKSATKTITVSSGLADNLTKRIKRNIDVIPNGYDPEAYDNDNDNDTNKFINTKFSITYTGKLHPPFCDLHPFFDAVAQLVRDGIIPLVDLEISFLGSERNYLKQVIPAKIKPIIHILERVPFSQCAQAQKRACILLHISQKNIKGILTGKIFEYLGARRPILSIPGDNGDVDKLLRETNGGISAKSTNTIKAQLLLWYKEWKNAGKISYHGSNKNFQKYSRKNQAKILSDIFNELLLRKHVN